MASKKTIIQTTEKFQIHLESVYGYKLNGNKNSSIKYYLRTPVEVKGDVYETYITLSSFVCPISFLVVNSNNNLLEITGTSTGTVQYLIPLGNYNINQLITTIQNLIGTNYSISINLNNYKLTITNSFEEFDVTANSTCWRLLGFDNGMTVSSIAQTILMPNVINLLGTQHVKIWCPTVSINNIDGKTGQRAPIIGSIPTNDINGGIMIYNNYTQFKSVCKEKLFTEFQIDIKDEFDDYLDLNGCDYSLVIEIEYFYEKEIKRDTFLDILNTAGTLNP